MMLPVGARLGPYVIDGRLGAGGMGEVYRARDSRLDRLVAIKILPRAVTADADARARFDREARTVSALDHPNICTLYDVGEIEGAPFLVMQYLDGRTLADAVRSGPLPPHPPPPPSAPGRCRSRRCAASASSWRRRCSTRTTGTSCTATSSRRTS